MSDASPELMTLFAEALEQSDPAGRAAYLDQACRDNAALRQRVEALLAAHDGAGRFLEPGATGMLEPGSPATPETIRDPALETPPPAGLATGDFGPVGMIATLAGATQADRPEGFVAGQVIAGRYTLREILGEGGMGSVYRADQTSPVRRQVALKLIKIGMDSSLVLARFDAERQALALMDHPNIARVYDGGATPTGQPFFVMELVSGELITDYCDRKRLPVRARLGLFVSVCQAVQHAHQMGIIHRDLKPGNVLVTEVDGRPTPKVIDFGVAKATDALGVILYELLAGSPPLDAARFRRGAILEMLRMVREVDPARPSTKVSTAEALPNIAACRNIDPAHLKQALRGDLDWIVMKALEKEPSRRYETANGFAADILRHLAHEPVLAAPPSRAYRLRKFMRKNRRAVIAASLLLLALRGGIAGTTYGLIRAEAQRKQAETAKKAEAEQRARAVAERDKATHSAELARTSASLAKASEATAQKEAIRANEQKRLALAL